MLIIFHTKELKASYVRPSESPSLCVKVDEKGAMRARVRIFQDVKTAGQFFIASARYEEVNFISAEKLIPLSG